MVIKLSYPSGARIVATTIIGFSLLGHLCIHLSRAQTPPSAARTGAGAQASPIDAEQSALNEAFQVAQNNPQILIKKLAEFLDRFPQSARRAVVLRTICTYAQEANEPGVVVKYGEMLLPLTPEDPKLLSMLIDALARENDQAGRARAIDYTSRLIKIAEGEWGTALSAGGSNDAAATWTERIAGLYERRAGLYRANGAADLATADDEKSFAISPTARVAEQLGDDALAKGDPSGALDEYLTAFVLPDSNADRRTEIRRKLGSLYLAKHHSEKGLGDLVLEQYDRLMPRLAPRDSGSRTQNLGQHDPFTFVLEGLNGASLPMNAFRGKVTVVDFWATWCGPCRLQGKLVDQVAQSLRSDSNVAFLSVNIDQDRSGVPAFLKQAGWTVPVAYSQGLDQLLSVRTLPTLVIFDRQGHVAYREEGVDPETFTAELTRHLHQTLEQR